MTADGISIDEGTHTLSIAATYRASAKKVWHAWTDPVAIAQWWGPHGCTPVMHAMDVRPGGEWRYSMGPDEESDRCLAVYREVEPERLLSYRDSFADADWHPVGDATPTEVTFTAKDGGTQVRIATTYPDDVALRQAAEDGMAQGFQEAFERLGTALGRD